MLSDGRIEAARVWKRFRGDQQRLLFRDRLERFGRRRNGHRGRGWRWALRDVDLVIDPGEAVGLVGPNGSGKTTMLKILCRVMYPYAGRVEVGGRVGALIEVKAGIHPELSGRENILLQGSLLGFGRREVIERFDEIVAFAELDDAIDRQVKYYSSGMQMRLGFAIAACLEPDILLVDEVLAVGDATFQQKCLDRMRQVLDRGTTIVFVSHDLASVEALCNRAVWLRGGSVEAEGPVRDVLGSYRQRIEQAAEIEGYADGVVRIVKMEVTTPEGDSPRTQTPLEIRVVLENPDPRPAIFYLGFSEGPATFIFILSRGITLMEGETRLRAVLPRLPLPMGRYYIWAGASSDGRDVLPWHPAAWFDVIGPGLDDGPVAAVRSSPVHVEALWEVDRG